jgi:hypothetical protein
MYWAHSLAFCSIEVQAAHPNQIGRVIDGMNLCQLSPQGRPYATSLLVTQLSERYGEDRIFHDLEDIDIGDIFVDCVNLALESCSVLIASVGPDWLKQSMKKLHRDDDPVRLEIGTALARNILVIPVLCNTKMPDADDLPFDLREFAFKNALSLRSTDLDTDIKN